jgi:hypothetical protein
MSDLDIQIRDRIQIIRFTRPDKKNALKSTMYSAMTDALIAGDASPDVAVHVFLGSGGMFTAGSDIAEFIERAKGGSSLGAPVLDFIRYLPQIRKPVIAAVDGLAIGVGTAIWSTPARPPVCARRSSTSACCRKPAPVCWRQSAWAMRGPSSCLFWAKRSRPSGRVKPASST